ncbi:MAG: hypothetical protein OSB19_09495 [Opitutaceae bacterium]|nr:hypothetical protein [Opitutaceae bacterium]
MESPAGQTNVAAPEEQDIRKRTNPNQSAGNGATYWTNFGFDLVGTGALVSLTQAINSA